MLRNILLTAALVVAYLHQPCFVLGRRRCRDTSLSINGLNLVISHEETLRGTTDDFKLFVRVNWTMSGATNEEFDGFLIRLRRSPEYNVISPVDDDCEASPHHIWIKTDNSSECVTGNTTGLQCTSHIAPAGNESYCPCDKKACPALSRYDCIGTTTWMKDRLGQYHSIPNTRRSIEYEIAFNTAYLLEMMPYHRVYTMKATRYAITQNWSCAETLASKHGLSVIEANQKCCESDVPAVAPLHFQDGELILDTNTRTLNMTVSWIPPSPNKLFIAVYTRVYFTSTYVEEYQPVMTEHKLEGSREGNETCALDYRRQTSTLYNLLPGTEYRVSVVAGYDGEMQSECSRGKCGFHINIKTDFDPCDKKWTSCDTGFKCEIIEGGEEEVTVPQTRCVPADTVILTSSTPIAVLATTSTSQSVASHVSTTTERKVIETTEPGIVGKLSSTSSLINFPTKVSRNPSTQGGFCKYDPPYCHKNAVCDYDPGTSKTTCTCEEGFVGDGISTNYAGTGCGGCTLSAKCHFLATCVQLEPPSDGFTCRCPDAYYGDGLNSGSGCESRAKRTATIVVPIILLCIILLILVCWCFCSRGKRKYHRTNNVPL